MPIIDRAGSTLTYLRAALGAVVRDIASKAGDVVDARDFNGFYTTSSRDSTVGLQKALASMSTGGTLKVPAGVSNVIKIGDELTPTAGVTVVGDGNGDRFNGAPPPDTNPTMIYQETPGKACFVFSGTAGTSSSLRNLALSPSLNPDATGGTDGKIGIKFTGTYPDFVWHPLFENVTIYNFDYAVQCIDPLSGTVSGPHPFDWSVAPATFKNCRFLYPRIAAYMDTNNGDVWSFENCGFQVPANGAGAYLRRCGLINFHKGFAAGAVVNSNRFLQVHGVGSGAIDKITIENFNAETLTQFIAVFEDLVSPNDEAFTLSVRNCGCEQSADIYLGALCRLVSEGNKFSANVNIDSAAVRISSRNDRFAAGFHWQFLSSNPRNAFWSYEPGPEGDPTYADWLVQRGIAVVRVPGAPVPVALNWNVGDRIENKTPTIGQPKALVCTAAGTPGTWASEGNL